MISDIRLSNMSEVTEVIQKKDFDTRSGRYRSSYVFRGLHDCSYHLVTSLKRNCSTESEQLEPAIIRNFAKYAASENPLLLEDKWNTIILGQHHGLPTRLLDWTYSPLAALHFATDDTDYANFNEKDSVIWAVDVNEVHKLLSQRYKEKLSENYAFFFTVGMLNEICPNIDQFDADMKENSILFLEPPSIDQRIINQYSYFSVIPNGMNDIEAFLAEKTQNTKRYIIDKSLKWCVRDMLDGLNINERIIYPGYDGIASWLKRHYYYNEKVSQKLVEQHDKLYDKSSY